VKKNHILLLAFLFVTAISIVFWLFFMGRKRPEKIEATQQTIASQSERKGPTATASASSIVPPKPRLFRMKGYPPTTAEHKAMWDWWRAMEKADLKFQWKMPIEFYGVVVDQFGFPIDEATIHFAWTAIDDSHEIEVLSESNGSFEFIGRHGKALDVSVRKLGFLPTRESRHSFEYAAFFDDFFHVPDKNNPVVFRLQKLVGAEPMLKFITNSQVGIGPKQVVLNVETGKLGTDGDLSFSILTGAKGRYGPDFTIMITAMNGAAFAFSEEEFMFNAPETGYRNAVVFNRLSTEPNYSRVQPYRFYVKTRTGKYAAVTGEISIREGMSEGKAGFHAIIYHNPSGSRNLEFDHRKWLNR
jgi:hypothetical protein